MTWRLTAAMLSCTVIGPTPAVAADIERGAALFETHCRACHASDGRPALPGSPDLSRPTALLKPDTTLLAAIRAGRGAMPAYQGVLRDRDILDIVAHLRQLR